MIKQGCQMEANFVGAGVKKGIWSQQQLSFIMKKGTFLFKKGIFMLKKGSFVVLKITGGSIAPSASRLRRPCCKILQRQIWLKKKKISFSSSSLVKKKKC